MIQTEPLPGMTRRALLALFAALPLAWLPKKKATETVLTIHHHDRFWVSTGREIFWSQKQDASSWWGQAVVNSPAHLAQQQAENERLPRLVDYFDTLT